MAVSTREQLLAQRAALFALQAEVVEAAMLAEALRRSTADAEEPQEQAIDEMDAAMVISTIPRIKWGCEKEECSLCLDEFSEGEELLQLKCSHVFHEQCLGPWVLKSKECPLCKQHFC
jgi:hypothetical protein